MSNQIVYTTQSFGNKNENGNDQHSNSFFLTPDQLRALNLFMPLGYILAPRSKLPAQGMKKKDTTLVDSSLKKTRRVETPQIRSEVIQPVRKQIIPPKVLTPDMTKCLRIITKIKKHPKADPFLLPVDTTLITDYLTYVKEPIDFSTIQENIMKDCYVTINQFVSDVRKVFANAYTYNQKNSPIYNVAVEVEKFFNKILQEEDIFIGQSSFQSQSIQQHISIERQPSIKPKQQIKKKPSSLNITTIDVPLTMQEKRNLGVLIKKLPRENLRGVWEIVCDHQGQATSNTQLQFDIQALSVKKARALQNYVKQVLSSIEYKLKQQKLKKQQQQQQLRQQQSENESSFLISDDD